MHDVDDPRSGAFVPTTRLQLEEFLEREAFVTLDTGERVSVRRHRDALNHMRTRHEVSQGQPVIPDVRVTQSWQGRSAG